MRKIFPLFVLFFLSCPLFASPSRVTSSSSSFQKPEKIEKPGLSNFYKVSDQYYRGAQPSAEGFKQLSDLGVKTVINLRSFHSDRSMLKGLNLTYHHIHFNTWHPEEEDILAFLKIATDPKQYPIFVHCQHGSDRTGMMTAIYRIVVQGWEKQAAIDEMVKGGFGFHSLWQNIIHFMGALDVEKFKRDRDHLNI